MKKLIIPIWLMISLVFVPLSQSIANINCPMEESEVSINDNKAPCHDEEGTLEFQQINASNVIQCECGDCLCDDALLNTTVLFSSAVQNEYILSSFTSSIENQRIPFQKNIPLFRPPII